ncbi:MAG TPA: aminodeoxychorismate/anthranilate synthase component II [Vicinamibacterales bacterium]|nr:aminodeoxychorismate/anthranilate synthase component II [Vicinamibacterales bacterium]
MTRVILLLDNYDSFTWNLAHRLGELGAEVQVVRNDAVSVDDVARRAPERIVISPGPGRPEAAGISVPLLRRFAGTVPILGVCLGHQALAVAFGGRVERADAPMHGKTSRVAHEASYLFAGLSESFDVGRYHSLVIPQDGVPPAFVRSAWVIGDGTVMGIRHERWPVFGVQFHPESVLTPAGQRILRNFLEIR